MEQILAWKKAYSQLQQQHNLIKQTRNDQLTTLNNQLFLLESCLRRKQKQIGEILMQSECAIVRQQKIINSLSSRFNKTNKHNNNNNNKNKSNSNDSVDSKAFIDFEENLNDSDSAVVLEDQEDTDSTGNNNSLTRYRRKIKTSSPGVTVMRSISDTINSNLCKFAFRGTRRTDSMSCRSDISETASNFDEDTMNEAIDKFSNSETNSNHYDFSDGSSDIYDSLDSRYYSIYNLHANQNNGCAEDTIPPDRKTGTQLIKYNRVMSNHRSVTKPKDVKYKRINKAKSKSLEELRGKLRHWVENGTIELMDTPQKAAQSVV